MGIGIGSGTSRPATPPIIAIFGLIFLGVSIFALKQDSSFKKDGIATHITVTECVSHAGGDSEICYADYVFQGRKYEHQSVIGTNPRRAGGYKAYIKPSDPETPWISERSTPFFFLLFAAMGVGLLILALVRTIRWFRTL